MPSPCAPLTSSPFLSNVRTASLSRFMAASATGAGPAAFNHDASANKNAHITAILRPAIRMISLLLGSSGRRRNRLQVEAAGRIAELLHVVETDVLHHRQEHVGHRRAV